MEKSLERFYFFETSKFEFFISLLIGLIMMSFVTSFEVMGDPVASTDIVFDIPVGVPVQKAWNAWTHSSELEKWLTAKADVNPVLGGAYELFWEPEKPTQNSTMGCKVTALVAERMISFTWKGAVPFADLMNNEPLPTWVAVTFEANSPNSTIVHFRHSGWGSSMRWQQARQWQEDSWRTAFSELKNYLEKAP
jgi:uncharacterized protein YndB with AHSA1/START domain